MKILLCSNCQSNTIEFTQEEYDKFKKYFANIEPTIICDDCSEKINEKQKKENNQKRKDRLIELSNLTKYELENKTFQKYESMGKRAEFRSAVVNAVRDNKNIILKGKSGTGKSHLAVAIIINAIEKNIIAGKLTWHNLKVKFSEFFSEENIQQMFWKYKLILIDEYMIEKMSTTLYNNFLQFLEYCLNNKKQLIITTNNFEINDLKEDDRLYRRMNACIDIIIDTNNIPVYEKKLNIEVVKL